MNWDRYIVTLIAGVPVLLAWIEGWDIVVVIFIYVFLGYLILLDVAADVEELKERNND